MRSEAQPLPPLVLISDAERVGEERFLEAAAAAVRGGLRMVQVREPAWAENRVRDLALRVRDLLREGIPGRGLLIVGRRPDLAVEIGADGVHVAGPDTAQAARARAIVGPEKLVGYSAHSAAEIEEVLRAGASHAFLSPILRPLSKPATLPPIGFEGLGAACRRSTLPVYALGGMLPEHAGELRRAGAAGAAMIGGLLDAPDPEAAARRFLQGWEEASRQR